MFKLTIRKLCFITNDKEEIIYDYLYIANFKKEFKTIEEAEKYMIENKLDNASSYRLEKVE